MNQFALFLLLYTYHFYIFTCLFAVRDTYLYHIHQPACQVALHPIHRPLLTLKSRMVFVSRQSVQDVCGAHDALLKRLSPAVGGSARLGVSLNASLLRDDLSVCSQRLESFSEMWAEGTNSLHRLIKQVQQDVAEDQGSEAVAIGLSSLLRQAARVLHFIAEKVLVDLFEVLHHAAQHQQQQQQQQQQSGDAGRDWLQLLYAFESLLRSPSPPPPSASPATVLPRLVGLSSRYGGEAAHTAALCAAALPSVGVLVVPGETREDEWAAPQLRLCWCLVTPHHTAGASGSGDASSRGTLPPLPTITLEQLQRGLRKRFAAAGPSLGGAASSPVAAVDASGGATATAAPGPSVNDLAGDAVDEDLLEFEGALTAIIGSSRTGSVSPAALTRDEGRRRRSQGPEPCVEVGEGRGNSSVTRCNELSDAGDDDDGGSREARTPKRRRRKRSYSPELVSARDYSFSRFRRVEASQVVEYGDDNTASANSLQQQRQSSSSPTKMPPSATGGGVGRSGGPVEEEPFQRRQRQFDQWYRQTLGEASTSAAAVDRWLFQVSVNESAKMEVVQAITRLGGRVELSPQLHPQCTHLIVSTTHLERSEKHLSACAAGVCMMPPSYLMDCEKSGGGLKWTREELRQYDLNPMRAVNHAPGTIFREWRVLLLCQDANVAAGIARVLQMGGCQSALGIQWRGAADPGGATNMFSAAALLGGDQLLPGSSRATSPVFSSAGRFEELCREDSGVVADYVFRHATHILIESRAFSPVHRSNFLMPDWVPTVVWEGAIGGTSSSSASSCAPAPNRATSSSSSLPLSSAAVVGGNIFSLDILHFSLCARSVEVNQGMVFGPGGALLRGSLPPLRCRLVLREVKEVEEDILFSCSS